MKISLSGFCVVVVADVHTYVYEYLSLQVTLHQRDSNHMNHMPFDVISYNRVENILITFDIATVRYSNAVSSILIAIRKWEKGFNICI